jgi:hypothetical protein
LHVAVANLVPFAYQDVALGVYALTTFLGLVIGVEREPGLVVRGGRFTHIMLAVSIALIVVFVPQLAIDDGWVFTLALTTLMSGLGLGAAAAPPVSLLQPDTGTRAIPGTLLLFLIGIISWLGGARLRDTGSADEWSFLLFGFSCVFALIALRQLVAAIAIGRMPVLHLPTTEDEPARVVRRDGSSMNVRVEAERANRDENELILLSYSQVEAGVSPYRTNMPQVTADTVFRGSAADARYKLVPSAWGWLCVAIATAVIASY